MLVKGNITLANGGAIVGSRLENLSSDPVSPYDGQVWFNTTSGKYKGYNGTSVVEFALGDLTNYLALSGGTMTGALTLAADPTNDLHAATKNYVDNNLAGLRWKTPGARASTTAALPSCTYDNGTAGVGATLTGDLNGALPAQDGVTLEVGNYLLVRHQASGLQNGLFVVTQVGDAENPFILTRANNADTTAKLVSAAIFVEEGTAHGDFAFVSTIDSTAVIGTTAILFQQFTGAASWVDGVGITRIGNTVNVNMGAGITNTPSDEVGIDLYSASGLFLTEDGTTSSTATGAQLAVKLDGSTLSVSGAGVKVANAGITETQLATSVAGDGLTGGAGTALAVGAGTGITVTANAVAIDTTWADNRYINTSGDTMTGALTLAADPVNALEAATKQYVDAVNTRLAAGYVVYDGTATAATSHVVTHNMGNKYVGVTVVDEFDNVMVPDSIVFNSVNQLTVSFNAAEKCYVVVNGLKAA
jgi:hypothetical protein